MLKMIYDAKFGQPIRDGDLDEKVLWLLHLAADSNQHEFRFATDNILNAIRVAVVENRLPLARLSVFYCKPEDSRGPEEEIELRMYSRGGIRPWPDGFCDRNEFFLWKLSKGAV